MRPGRSGRAAKLPDCEVLFQKGLLRGLPAAAQSSEGPAARSCLPHRPGPAEMWRLEACRELPSISAWPGSHDLEQQHREPKLRRWLVPWPEGTSPACHTRAAKRRVRKEKRGVAVQDEQWLWGRSRRSHRIPGLLLVLLVALGLPRL